MATGCTIAVDGPAASGKTTLARRLAERLGCAFLDTGLLYRGVAKALADAGATTSDKDSAVRAALALTPAALDPELLATEAIGRGASEVAVIPEVRQALLDLQRRVAAAPAGAILAGRDIGTVVCPLAPVKLFVTADVDKRAERRLEQLRRLGRSVNIHQVLDELKERDRRDTERAVAPLCVAEDALVVDTTMLDVEQAFAVALRHVTDRMAALSRQP